MAGGGTSSWFSSSPNPECRPPLDPHAYASPACVTIALLSLYFCFLFFQTYSKLYLLSKEHRRRASADPRSGWRTALGLQAYKYHEQSTAEVKYNNYDPLAILGDRIVGNTLEQLVPFLCSLWLYALFVAPAPTRITGSIYVASRAIYPLAFWLGSPWILLSTVPGYLVIWFHLGATLLAIASHRG